MPFTTNDVEVDFLAKLAELLPADVILEGVNQNALPGPLRPTARPGIHEVFVQWFGGTRTPHNDGVVRVFALQVTVRAAQNDYLGGHAFAVAIHDALEGLVGGFTGESGQRYFDVNPVIAGPNHLGSDAEDQEMFAEAFDVSCNTVRT